MEIIMGNGVVRDKDNHFSKNQTFGQRIKSASQVIVSQVPKVIALGALDVSHEINVLEGAVGVDAFSLVDGYVGQRIYLLCNAVSTSCVITPANFTGGATITFNAVGDSVELIFSSGAWFVIGGNSYAVA